MSYEGQVLTPLLQYSVIRTFSNMIVPAINKASTYLGSIIQQIQMMIIIIITIINVLIYTGQKMKFSNKDFFSKCDQIRRFLLCGVIYGLLHK